MAKIEFDLPPEVAEVLLDEHRRKAVETALTILVRSRTPDHDPLLVLLDRLLGVSLPIPEHHQVVLAKPLQAFGRSLPAGASGVVVSVYAGGEAYAVEFFEPENCVLEVEADYLRPC